MDVKLAQLMNEVRCAGLSHSQAERDLARALMQLARAQASVRKYNDARDDAVGAVLTRVRELMRADADAGGGS